MKRCLLKIGFRNKAVYFQFLYRDNTIICAVWEGGSFEENILKHAGKERFVHKVQEVEFIARTKCISIEIFKKKNIQFNAMESKNKICLE